MERGVQVRRRRAPCAPCPCVQSITVASCLRYKARCRCVLPSVFRSHPYAVLRRVLHEELSASKARMAEFVEQLRQVRRQQQQQQQQHSQSTGGSAVQPPRSQPRPDPPPPVRVK